MTYFFRVIALLSLLLGIIACSPDTQTSQISEAEIRHPVLKRNCPMLLSAQITGEANQQVIIRPIRNEIYNPALGDECKGDFKRILDDLPEFAEYFDVFGADIVVGFGEVFYSHDSKAGFVRRTRRDLSRALNGYWGINHQIQKDDNMGRFDEFGTEPYDSNIMVPISNRVLKEEYYQDYEYFLNRLLHPFGLRILNLNLSNDTTICRNFKNEKCTNDFAFPNRWDGLIQDSYALGGVRGQWRLTNLDIFTPEYRNCPVIVKHIESSKGLHLLTDRNEEFDADLPNECEGRLETVWQDIELFEPLMKKYAPNIYGRFHVGFHLDYFSETQLEISQFLSSEIKKRPASFNIRYDPNELEDVLKLRSEYLGLFRDALPSYVTKNHVSTLNDYLRPHGIEMEAYDSGEKTSFCIVKWDNCILYFPRNDEIMNQHPELEVFFLGTWDYGWKTTKIEP